MPEAQKELVTSSDRKNSHSRPVFKQSLRLNSLQAQYVMGRSFDRVSISLFSIDVILRIIGEQAEVDHVEGIIQGHITTVSDDIDKAIAQLNKLMVDNDIDSMPEYTSPVDYELEISSPQVALFASLIRKLDTLMARFDTLWLNSVLTNKQRSDASYQWRQRLVNVAGRIIHTEKRARIAAHTKGKAQEVADQAPEVVETDAELAAAAELPDNEQTKKTQTKKAKAV